MTETEWGIVADRLRGVWPKGQGGWPDATLAVWRQEIEEAELGGEEVYEAVRALAQSSSRAPAMADLIREASVLRARRRQASRAISDASLPKDALPEGVVAIVKCANYADIAVVDDRLAQQFERSSERLAPIPDDAVVVEIIGRREAVPSRFWP